MYYSINSRKTDFLMVKLTKLKLIVYDFDGVMTNNKVFTDETGHEFVQVNRADGLGVSEIKKMGLQQIILSTEKNPVVSARAKKLGIPCLQGIDNKAETLKGYCKDRAIEINEIAYVGNDINDLEAMNIAGVTFCPSDAHERIKAVSDVLLKSKGGDGVVREIFDCLTDF